MTRAEAFEKFDGAAVALDAARARSKTVCEQAAELESQAREMRETATATVDRALLEYATTHGALTKLIALSSWDERHAADLVKSAQTMKALAAK